MLPKKYNPNNNQKINTPINIKMVKEFTFRIKSLQEIISSSVKEASNKNIQTYNKTTIFCNVIDIIKIWCLLDFT